MTDLPAAVIFDLDGCLVDSEVLSIRALTEQIHAASGLHVSTESIRQQYLGVAISVVMTDISRQIGRDIGPDFIDAYEERLFASYRRDLHPIAGAADMLNALAARGIPVAIGTGGSVRRMHMTLELTGLAPFFQDTCFSADQVAQGKPAPDLFLLAARHLGADPTACVVLEDSPHGITAARAAGMRAVGFVGGSHLATTRAAHAALLRNKGAAAVEQKMPAVLAAVLNGGQA